MGQSLAVCERHGEVLLRDMIPKHVVAALGGCMVEKAGDLVALWPFDKLVWGDAPLVISADEFGGLLGSRGVVACASAGMLVEGGYEPFGGVLHPRHKRGARGREC